MDDDKNAGYIITQKIFTDTFLAEADLQVGCIDDQEGTLNFIIFLKCVLCRYLRTGHLYKGTRRKNNICFCLYDFLSEYTTCLNINCRLIYASYIGNIHIS